MANGVACLSDADAAPVAWSAALDPYADRAAAEEDGSADHEAEVVPKSRIRERIDAHVPEEASDQREDHDETMHETEQKPGCAGRPRRWLMRAGGQQECRSRDTQN